MSNTRKHSLCAALLIVIALAAGCRDAGPMERYELRGTVVEVDREKQRVTLDHEEIPGYMPAMIMPFRVKDRWVLDAVEPGRLVHADLVVARSGSWIENVTVMTAPGPPSQPSRVEGSTEPTPGAPAPPFALVNHANEPVTNDRYRGKALALTFIYTRCPIPDYCPLMTENFAEVERTVRADAELAGAVRLLSISIDPEFDTPDVMRQYGLRVTEGAIPANWDFATGTPAEVRTTARAYGLVYETEKDEIVHTLRTAVIAPDGTLYKMYRGNEWRPAELVADLTSLVRAR